MLKHLFYSVFWTSTKICQKNDPQKNDNFSDFAKQRVIKKNRFVATPLLTKNWCFQLVFFETKNKDVEQKHNFKSAKKTKRRKRGFKEKRRQETKKEKRLMKKNFVHQSFWCCSFHETKAEKKEKERKRQKQGSKRKQKRKTGRKEKRRRRRDRQRKKNWKRGRPKKTKEEQRETLKNKPKMPFSRGKTRFFCSTKQRKERN